MNKTTWLSWSTGKDSAWTLHQLQSQTEYKVTGLVTTVNQLRNRVAMHSTRLDILQTQAKILNLPLYLIEIPEPCSNEIYEAKMQQFIEMAEAKQVQCMAFGDIFLEDIRDYRIKNLESSSIEAIFPLWQQPSKLLAETMLTQGLKAVITCVDSQQLDKRFVGREFNQAFIEDLPEGVDPCGENGEFHTCVYDGPFFEKPLKVKVGQLHQSGQFYFADVTLTADCLT